MPSVTTGIFRTAPAGGVNAAEGLPSIQPGGALVVIDFYAKSILDGLGYQVQAGTITTPLTGDVLITDTKAELSADVIAGAIMIPIEAQVDIEALGGTLPQVAVKSAATVSSAGTAFVPLPLRSAAGASNATARVAAAGGVTVTAELVTTTLRHYAKTITVAGDVQARWDPIRPPELDGARCVYLQVGSVTTGSTYFAHLNFLEFTDAQLGR